MTTHALVTLVVLLAVPSFATARQSQSPSHGFRVEAGHSDTHSGQDRSVGGAFRGFWTVGRDGIVSVEAGGLAGMPYLGGDAGLFVRLPVNRWVFGVLRGGVGLLLEDGYTGTFIRVGGGFGVQVNRGRAVTVTYQRGIHGGTTQGPHLFMVGLEHRVGRR